MTSSYDNLEITICIHEYGVLIKSPLPVHTGLPLIMLLAKAYECDIFNSEIAKMTNSNFCLTTIEKAKLWKKDLERPQNLS